MQYYRCKGCHQLSAKANGGDSAEINVALKELLTGHDKPVYASGYGTREQMEKHSSEERSRALEVEAELEAELYKEQCRKMKSMIFKSRCF